MSSLDELQNVSNSVPPCISNRFLQPSKHIREELYKCFQESAQLKVKVRVTMKIVVQIFEYESAYHWQCLPSQSFFFQYICERRIKLVPGLHVFKWLDPWRVAMQLLSVLFVVIGNVTLWCYFFVLSWYNISIRWRYCLFYNILGTSLATCVGHPLILRLPDFSGFNINHGVVGIGRGWISALCSVYVAIHVGNPERHGGDGFLVLSLSVGADSQEQNATTGDQQETNGAEEHRLPSGEKRAVGKIWASFLVRTVWTIFNSVTSEMTNTYWLL